MCLEKEGKKREKDSEKVTFWAYDLSTLLNLDDNDLENISAESTTALSSHSYSKQGDQMSLKDDSTYC